MLINLRNALMAGKRLPYDAEVEYLESTGTQWIDTGVTPDVVNVDMDISLIVSSAGHLFGSRINSAFSSVNGLWSSYGSKQGEFRKDWVTENAYLSLSLTTPNLVSLRSSTSGSSITYGGTTWTGGVKTPNNLSIFLFAVNNNGAPATGNLKIYQCKIWRNNTLVRDYIPVRRGTVGYLYDRVSGKLFGNAGTGDFVLGQDVVPVEYILQTGTQYIDTLYPMADTRCEVVTVDWSGHSTTYREFMAGAASGSYLIELSANGYYGTAPTNLSSIQVSQKDRIRWDYTVGSAPSLYINDVFAINDTLIRVPNGNVMTGGIGTPGANYPKMKIYSLDVYTDDSVQVRKMLPVRVGTEGAMMDVLTRRIYRNAGTGAFTYGNDLKYPIPSE